MENLAEFPSNIQKIKTNHKHRIETGALQVNDDWTGLFIRGDDCIMLLNILTRIKSGQSLTFFEEPVLDMYIEEIEQNVLKRKNDD